MFPPQLFEQTRHPMRISRVFAPVILASFALCVTTGAQSTPPAHRITVGKNVHVSTAHAAAAHNEVILAADPADPNVLLTASHVMLGKGNNAVIYRSADGGNTWKIAFDSVPGGDPALGFGPNHTAFYTSLLTDSVWGVMYRSPDAGLKWERALYNQHIVAPVKSFAFDREYITADLNPASKYYGNIYMNGTSFLSPENLPPGQYQSASATTIYTSRDNGKTWNNPVMRLVFKPYWVFGTGNAVVTSTGAVVSLFGIRNDSLLNVSSLYKPANATINVAVSEDGGGNITRQVQISSWEQNLPGYVRSAAQTAIPWIAVDPGSMFKDRLYAVWADASSKRYRIMFASSSDVGKTWTQPTVIDDSKDSPGDEGGPDGLVPTVAVNKDGVVVATWYQRTGVNSKAKWELRATSSFDGGDSWLPSVPVTEKMMPDIVADSQAITTWAYIAKNAKDSGAVLTLDAKYEPEEVFIGDTQGLIATSDGRFHATWIDKRTGTPQIFTATIDATGAVTRNGGGALANLDDIGGALSMKVVKTVQDRATKRVTLTVKFKNASTDTIVGPLQVRVLSVSSPLGAAKIVNADNGLSGVGAIWDFSSTLAGSRLAPDAEGAERKLVFEFPKLGPIVDKRELERGVVALKAKIFGKRIAGAAKPK
jgi:hypothetical protein